MWSLAEYFSSTRRFILLKYQHGHGHLYLTTREDGDERIGILFTDVRSLEIRTMFSGITIAAAQPPYPNDLQTIVPNVMDPGLKVYSLTGDDWMGYILAGGMNIHHGEAPELQNQIDQ